MPPNLPLSMAQSRQLAVLLRHYEGIPKSEIAEQFDITRRWMVTKY